MSEESKQKPTSKSIGKGERKPFQVRLPGFIGPEEDVGLGDVIKRATSIVGIKPCRSCDQRATALNQRFVFSGRHAR